jgi:hypothetical protein
MMKLQALISVDKIDEMDYRFILLYKAIELGCERFFSCIRNSDGSQGILVRIEGNEDQISDFKKSIADQVHDGAKFSCITFEEYTGHVPTIEVFLAFCTTEVLDRWDREYKSAEKDERSLVMA